jgi:hypothetical protein
MYKREILIKDTEYLWGIYGFAHPDTFWWFSHIVAVQRPGISDGL